MPGKKDTRFIATKKKRDDMVNTITFTPQKHGLQKDKDTYVSHTVLV